MFVGTVWFEIVLVLILILVNGFFAGAEIAVVSSRRSRINQMSKENKAGAFIVSRWLKEPEVFLATVQIGVTLVGALASAVGGATAIKTLKPHLQQIPWLADWAEPVAITLVVLAITFLSLVLGELTPKSLALSYRERMAVLVAIPIHWLSKAAKPLVHVLTRSTRLVLLLFGQRDIPKELFVSEEEIRFLIKEGGSQGIFDLTEQQMIPKVFDFSEALVRDMMLPRERIVALDINTARDRLLTIVSEEGYTRLPVYQGSLDNIVGVLHMKDLIHIITIGKIVVLQDLLRPALFVADTTHAKDLLKLFQKQRQHMAIVRNAQGKTAGLITLEDLIERIVGDIQDEHDQV